MRRITATDLANWAPTRNCQENLPLLIRRLLRASTVTISKILIPAGDNVIQPGYDGKVEVIEGTEYIPSGISVWEMGSNRDFKAKAQKDLEKRSEKVKHTEAIQTTFVFVTPYTWSDKNNWIEQKRVKGIWKDILVIDGEILEEWIEQLPSIGAWLSDLLGTPFANILPIKQFWEEWSTTSKYAISTTLVVSGREKEAQALNDFLSAVPDLLSIKASTTEEAIAFIGAVVQRMDEGIRESIFSKAIIVYNEQDFRPLLHHKYPMIFIANFQAGPLVDQALKRGHHVILPIGNDITATEANLELSRIRKYGFEKGLIEMGFSEEEAEKLTQNSGQSLSVLRRLLEFEKNSQPAWAKNGCHTDILPVLLAGKWNDEKEDGSIISQFAGEPYERYISKLSRWKVEKDPPVLEVKSIWRLTSPLDAWSILSPFVTKTDLDKFRSVFLEVLPDVSSASEGEPETAKQYRASFYGKKPKFSYSLKEGLCQSLILIAVFGERFKLGTTASPQRFADDLIYELLFDASGNTWCNTHSFLPLLAEASPTSFLLSVENSLSKDEPLIMAMFGNKDDLFSSGSDYTGLLWALENLLIAPEYLLRATLILANLARLDPGGRLSNRPINTLRAAFIPWYGQTRADLSIRKMVLSKLVDTEPVIAWQLFLNISPQDHASVSPIHQCKWRFDTQYLERSVTSEEVWDFNTFVFTKLCFLAKGDEEKIAQLVGFYPNIGFNERLQLLSLLNDAKETIVHKRNLIWNELRKLLSHHREHSEQPWALPEDELAKIEVVYKMYTPAEAKEQYKYLFEDTWDYFPEGFKRKEMSFEEREKFVDEKRRQVFKKIYDESGWPGIVDILNNLTNTYQFARTVAACLPAQEELHILASLSSEVSNKLSIFARDFISVKSRSAGNDWIISAYKILRSLHSSSKIESLFFLSLPQSRETWNLLETAEKDVSDSYWSQVRAYFHYENLVDKLYVIEKLRSANRFVSIIDNIAYIANDIPSKLLVEILLQASSVKTEENARLNANDVSKIFELFYERNDLETSQLTNLEWIYLPFLGSRYSVQKPRNLLNELKNNPEFAAEVISYVYLSDDGKKEKELSEEEATKKFKQADSARKLLDSWRDLPGVDESGEINAGELNEWINRARARAQEIGWSSAMDSQIGSLLARYPRNVALWPPDDICEVLDRLNSKSMLSHFRTEIYNSRGTYSKAAYEGGNQERALSEYFNRSGKRILSKYPLTASLLLKLAEGYAQQAKDEDDNAHLDELR